MDVQRTYFDKTTGQYLGSHSGPEGTEPSRWQGHRWVDGTRYNRWWVMNLQDGTVTKQVETMDDKAARLIGRNFANQYVLAYLVEQIAGLKQLTRGEVLADLRAFVKGKLTE